MLKVIFFDAGNTLVFPDHYLTLAPLAERGVHVDSAHLAAAERAARRFRDSVPAEHLSPNTDREYWIIYFRELLGPAAEHELIHELVPLSQTSGNWRLVRPGTREALLALKQHYRLAVISNSDGRMANLLADVGLGELFESVTDSSRVGFQKPHPGIFRAALAAATIDPDESVYVGDIYSIDYLGATAVGMKAILMDPYGTYADNGLPRITDIAELESLLPKM
jgi:putative hydrolase of the HAD superfamily